jgi:hypothetical protein
MPSRGVTAPAKSGLHKKVTYTLPSDVVETVDERWRYHEMLNGALAESNGAYLADLVRRDSMETKPSQAKPR